MFRKFLLIALFCVSIAQVHGSTLEEAIDNGLKKIEGMYESARSRYEDAVNNANVKSELIDSKTDLFIEKARRVQESSRQALRSTAAATEEKAKANNRPQSVFRCIRGNEEKANKIIETYTNKFETDMERLLGTKQDNLETACAPHENMEASLKEMYGRSVKYIESCPNPSCVTVGVKSYSTSLNSVYDILRRVDRNVNTIVANFQRDANNYFNNSNRQVTRMRSLTIRNIRNCYYNGGRDIEDSQEI